MVATLELTSLFSELLIREAWLRDQDRFDEWLEYFADNVRYWAPVRQFMERGEENFHEKYLFCHVDDDLAGLQMRAKRIKGGATFTDEPPARIRRFVTNIMVAESTGNTAKVLSNLMIFRSHPGHADAFLTAGREDSWRKIDGKWKIEERLIIIDQDKLASYHGLF